MTELRYDSILARTVLIAEHRVRRPSNFSAPHWPAVSSRECPFCPGNESSTPPSVLERTDLAGRWRIRVVPNLYPAVESPPAADYVPLPLEYSGCSSRPAAGGHEVIIESSRHLQFTGELTVAELADVFDVYRERLRYWRSQPGIHYAIVFKNLGPQAGASLVHLHSQLIATQHVPQPIVDEHRRLFEHWRQAGECPMCVRVDSERQAGHRLVIDAGAYVAFCPPASLHPYECWVMPAEHIGQWEHLPAGEATQLLAQTLHGVLTRIEKALPGIGYNVIFRTATWTSSEAKYYHWRIEVRPRPATIAGLELGTGVYINHVAPERAAELLRR
jgi:UDPglucose--hexose-1-phosphate uridylyltransferase